MTDRADELRSQYPTADTGLIARIVAAERRLEVHTARAGRKTYRKPALDEALKEMAAAERDLARLWAQLERAGKRDGGAADRAPAAQPRRIGSGLDGLL